MATNNPKPKGKSVGKRRSDPLVKGARVRVADDLRKLMVDVRGDQASRKVLDTALKKLRLDPAEAAAFAANLRQIAKGGGEAKSLRAMLGEGPVPGRLPRPTAVAAESASATSLEPFPSEFRLLAEATRTVRGKTEKVMTQASEDGAKRLGFTLPELYQYMYGVLSRQVVKRDGHAGQQYNIFGVISEIGLHNAPGVQSAEEQAVAAALREMNVTPQALPADVGKLPIPRVGDFPPPPTPIMETMADVAALVMRHRPAQGILDLELRNVRDSGGQLVTDRLRGLLNLRKSPPEFIIVSIGEAKSQSGAGKIMGQLVEDMPRLLKGFRAPVDGQGAPTAFDAMQVRFGPQLVVAWLSEKAPPKGHVDSLNREIAKVMRGRRRDVPKVSQVAVPPQRTYDDARIIANEFQAALKALSAKSGGR